MSLTSCVGLGLEPRDIGVDVHGRVVVGELAQLDDLAFQLGDGAFEIQISVHGVQGLNPKRAGKVANRSPTVNKDRGEEFRGTSKLLRPLDDSDFPCRRKCMDDKPRRPADNGPGLPTPRGYANMRALLPLAMALAMTTTAQAALNIVSGPTRHMSCLAGVCTATSKKAQLNAGDLQTLLASGDVVVRTGGGAVTIGVLAPVTWASTSKLTLEAQMSVHFNAPVIAEGTSGVTIIPNYGGGHSGTLGFVAPGNLTFWDLNSTLVIGSGTYTLAGDIATLANDIQSNPNGLYALAKDYDASVDGTYQASPIQTRPNGVFEGLGHVISNLAIDPEPGTHTAGLFAQTDVNETIRDVGLENVNITAPNYSDSWTVGALVGINGNDTGGAIINSYSTGSVVLGPGSLAYGGGLVGFNTPQGTIVGSYSTCTVSALVGGLPRFTGGLVGFNGGLISGSHAAGMVSGDKPGGLAGWNTGPGVIENSYVTGQMSLYSGGGGLVYENSGTISGSYTNIAITAVGNSAGLAVLNDEGGTIEHSYALGSVAISSPGGEVAGLVAYNNGTIEDFLDVGLRLRDGSASVFGWAGGI